MESMSREKMKYCQLRIVVDNVLYSWESVSIHATKHDEEGDYRLLVETNPKVYNRRKYPRMPISHSCSIYVKDMDQNFRGKMVNVSANGFAFSVRDDVFADIKGKDVIVSVSALSILEGKGLEGCVIRSSNNEGEYIVGCRMAEDSEVLRDYVSKNYCA